VRVLIVTKIFPNAAEPLSAPFNRQQFRALAALPGLDVTVLGTIPWFPGARLLARWSSAGRVAAVPAAEIIDGLPVEHPRTLFIPRLAHGTWGPLYAASLLPAWRRHRGQVDVVLGSWAYPDGFAAVLLARALGVPAVVKLHGSDINVMAQEPGPRAQLAWALPRAAAVVAVSRPLADEVVALGVAPSRIAIVGNGVDGERFQPRDRAAARAALGLGKAPLAVYVGNLKQSKGVLDLLAAVPHLRARVPTAQVALVGGGEARAAVDAAAGPLGDAARVVGPCAPDDVATWMAAADVVVLPSWAEGTPNVLLEALASGRRVVATRVGGIPDVVPTAQLGTLVPPRDPPALADALAQALVTPYDPAAIAAAGARGGWASSAAALERVLRAAVSSSPPPR
jgi:teichuronic acid biosynthesis glycosyltransferase TuaC